ncbi:hypothetical protein Alide_3595 [Alicycliphilus denitrificans BC]|nr:hypothetical protein Alide_3595 [Alicycliphilus denitrificans BC]
MKLNIITTILTLCSLNPIYAQTNKNNIDMGCDSTCLNPGVMGVIDLSKNIAISITRGVIDSCQAYAGSNGVPSGATQGSVIVSYDENPKSSTYGQIIHINSSGCSIPSQPITVTRQCSAYVGRYGIASGSQGTFQITTEGNTYKPNYGSVISTDISGCYVSPPPPPQPPGCYGTAIQTWTDAFSKNGKQCAGAPPVFTAPNGITSANSYPGYFGATGSGVMYFKCISYGSNIWSLNAGFYNQGVAPFAPAQTCN